MPHDDVGACTDAHNGGNPDRFPPIVDFFQRCCVEARVDAQRPRKRERSRTWCGRYMLRPGKEVERRNGGRKGDH
jgi:hypothetical protein